VSDRIAALLRGDRIALPAWFASAVRLAAERNFDSAFPERQRAGSKVWAEDADGYVVAVFQRHVRPSNSPTFFRVSFDLRAELLGDQLKHRPRGLK
jgi:hypothetical protein